MKPKPSPISIYYNGKIFGGTGWELPLWEEVVLVQNGRIGFVGSQSELKQQFGIDLKHRNAEVPPELIDLQGQMLFPGFCDGHLHLAAGGESLSLVDLAGLNPTEVRHALQERARTITNSKQTWIRAFNWEPYRFDLDAEILEEWLPGGSVHIHQRDLHSCLCSYAVLDLAGLNKESKDPKGGQIGRQASGNLTGYLYENACEPVRKIRPRPDFALKREYILKAQQYLLSLGLTAVSEVIDLGNEKIYAELDQSGELILEVDGWLRAEHWDQISPPPSSGRRFQIKTLKMFLDGAFGSNTAALQKPYLHDSTQSGTLFYTDEELFTQFLKAQERGWRVAIHALGDRAVAQACRVLKILPKSNVGPHRIEHLQTLPANYSAEVAQTSAVVSIQPVHLLDDQKWLSGKIGSERTKNSFIWKSLRAQGVTLVLGSDWPVATPDPVKNLQAAINRCEFGSLPHPDFDLSEALTPPEAIRTISHGWAEAARLAERRGSLSSGQTADFTVVSGLDEDLRNWSQARVMMTVCDGKIVFRAS